MSNARDPRNSAAASNAAPPDANNRSRALDPAQSFLVQAPAGSGKTYLLTQRFLRLLTEVESPDQIVAITFTRAAAAEMRNRVLEALESVTHEAGEADDSDSLAALAARAIRHANRLGWRLLEQSGQLRILTIDAFCRSVALQSPLSWGALSGLGGQLAMTEDPGQLYRLAARRTVAAIARDSSPVRPSVVALLRWRDNNWNDVEDLIAEMLPARSRWFQDFVFAQDLDWKVLRQSLEAPFRREAGKSLERLTKLLEQVPNVYDRILALARFACETPGDYSPHDLAELAELSSSIALKDGADEDLRLESAVSEFQCVANFLMTTGGEWRRIGGLNKNLGFTPSPDGKLQKTRFAELVRELDSIPGLCDALAGFAGGLPVRYSDEEWELVQHCFAVLREAWGQLQVVFAETGTADYTEVMQMALRILATENGSPSDLAMRQADSIRHLLIDEFQDTSRPQHELLTRLIGAWPEREGRSCFCVGDPMQSIYGFRDAEVELFERMKRSGLPAGLEAGDQPFEFEFVPLRANFRTTRNLVEDLNQRFSAIFSSTDGGVRFSAAEAVRTDGAHARMELHLAFTGRGASTADSVKPGDPRKTAQDQLAEMVALVQDKLDEASRRGMRRFRIAVLARKRKSLTPVAEALTKAGIAFRSVDVVPLRERPEVLDALALARALLQPADRTAWLGVLRAPWCGLSLEELYQLVSSDNPTVMSATVPELLETRLPELVTEGRLSARAREAILRLREVYREATASRAAAGKLSLGTWLESIWLALGGGDTVTAEQAQNLRVLWKALDGLPETEVDVCGPALDAALDNLFAQPDPAASNEFGVQLMTIHKSKGLEFEMVIVPDLEAREPGSRREMMVWLERGLADEETAGNPVSEFLVAPIQAKGTKAGAAKAWVSKAIREQQRQEAMRLLYVAATRAREELHLFARPRFQADKKTGEPNLAAPTGLLATAWPAIEDEVRARFAAWSTTLPAENHSEMLRSIAAEANAINPGGLIVPFPASRRPAVATRMRRLPEGYAAPVVRSSPDAALGAPSGSSLEKAGDAAGMLYARTEGGLESRALGTAIHALLEHLGRLRVALPATEAAAAIADHLPAVVADLRRLGLSRSEARILAGKALDEARQSYLHPVGTWILAPHAGALSEARWSGAVGPLGRGGASGVRNLRADRVFRTAEMPPVKECGNAGWEPDSEPAWWIIDYKTSHAEGADLSKPGDRSAFLETHRRRHVGQLELYARVLRALHEAAGEPSLRIRAGLFYPRLGLFDFWNV